MVVGQHPYSDGSDVSDHRFVSPRGNDLCVLCFAETPYKTDDDVKSRLHYVEGVGQLCSTCDTKPVKGK